MATSEYGQFRIPPYPRITSDGKVKWRCIWPLLMHLQRMLTAVILMFACHLVLEVYDNIARESDDDEHEADKVLGA